MKIWETIELEKKDLTDQTTLATYNYLKQRLDEHLVANTEIQFRYTVTNMPRRFEQDEQE